MTNYVDGVAALDTLRGMSGLTPDLCLEDVWNAYHAHGAQSSVTYPTAMSAEQATPGMHAGDVNPPAGMPLWFGPRDGSPAGDVGISNGKGGGVFTWNTGMHEVTIAQRSAEIGRPYLGWTDHFMTDNAIVPGVGANQTLRPTKDAQAAVGVPAADCDGIYGPQTTWFVRQFQAAHGLQVDGYYGPLTDAAAFPNVPLPGVVAEACDFSQGRPGVPALIAAGRPNVFRYVGAYPDDPREIDPDELTEYLDNGVSVTFNYEGSGTDATSTANGVGDAQQTKARLAVLGHPDAFVYYSIDEQFAPDPVGYGQGVESVQTHELTGFYGSLDVLTALHDAGVGVKYWLTEAWLQGRAVPDWVTVFQSQNGQTIGGAAVDYDLCLADDWGQIRPTGAPASVTPPVVVQPAPAGLTEDGVLGPKTITRWQQIMGTPVDGVISTPSDLVKAVQTHLNAAGARDMNGQPLVVDGLGIAQNNVQTRTIYALQRYMGTPLDGIMSLPFSDVVQAVQRRLNTGKF